MVRTKKMIKAELAAAVAEPEPDLDKIDSLTAELRTRGGRPRRRQEEVSTETSPDSGRRIDPGQDPDTAGGRSGSAGTEVQLWRPMVADMIGGRRGRSAYGRIIG
ncbi:hypothetical protein [Streptomyces mirabilis]|uniref:Uncharacterized protein n=1 Tax=Streptomyces mirabilis TaxID=68239 RepID=A0ABU3V191_9ACTN|nr:hypothetical protein [Streptomyces mirabilis]MDU8999519.1 hypothetical protein [Streptomyces mirabilis]